MKRPSRRNRNRRAVLERATEGGEKAHKNDAESKQGARPSRDPGSVRHRYSRSLQLLLTLDRTR